ncbi:GNAT family N-acetyltransferase [Sphingomonas sp.]|uniref:GNAT family N-acetyltransferase n=1 Tax=Sphingomonas sp. TaxID=28214 RepID=UPI001DE84075|nr:GNAT family N-acetyltransferase [Sphingomonas sp.]MBX9796651.1 GNAT family N-acetyltransferase [Sphingomonas sp.]
MSAVSLPLKFQVGARTLFVVRRRLIRVPLDLDAVLAGTPPALPPLDRGADGYAITSLPDEQVAALARAAGGLMPWVRQRYTRYHVDLTIGHAAYLAGLSANTRSSVKRKTKKLAAESGGALDIRCYRTPDEMAEFHAAARAVSARTYQEVLLGSGLPGDEAFLRAMLAAAAAGRARGWLLFMAGQPIAYLYCPVVGTTVRYDYLGHDPAHADLSPGTVLQMAALADLFAEGGHRHFDFTEGEGQHKRQFATGGVPCADLLLLRPTLANRAAILALSAFDGAMAAAKRLVLRFGLQSMARKLRR